MIKTQDSTPLLSPEGVRYGRLVVLERLEATPGRHARVLVRCDCGTEKTVHVAALRGGQTKSCGCLRRDAPRARATHGLSRTPTYRAWHNMLQRCENPNHPQYADYGDRGIKVCGRWHNFALFLADMGERPEGMTLERKNNDGHYRWGNCVWATRKAQARNRRNSVYATIDGVTATLAEWSERSGVPAATIRQRRLRGWPDNRLLETVSVQS